MKTSSVGVELIKQFEGLRLQSYLCPAKIWTVGWGTTLIKGKPFGKGLTITKEQAEEYLADDLVPFEQAVNSLVKVKLTQNQFDALISFVYNVGADIDADNIAEGLGDSTLLKKLNAGDYKGAADQFLKWDKANGKVMKGLTIRRQAERALFLS
jgi:GH24 family phage-related lysozyme (muramidase)